MPRAMPSDEELAGIKRTMKEMSMARIDIFSTNAADYAKALGAFRAALVESGFSREEAMQVVLKVLEQSTRRPRFIGGRGDRER